ncbi:MAG: hypothetical protein MK201_01605 [Gammaproteobacteria bacterium]|nr:hypothetical protein [Gammaproteobacteria bacterium]
MKLKKLDLHGTKHEEVDRMVENFLFLNQNDVPLEIVCGNSQRMIDLVLGVLRRVECQEYDQIRFGTLIIRKL